MDGCLPHALPLASVPLIVAQLGEEESLLFASLDSGVAEGAVGVTWFWDGAEEC